MTLTSRPPARRSGLVLVAAIAVLLAAACFGGGDDGDEPAPTATPTATLSPEGDPAEEPTPSPTPEVELAWPAVTTARIMTDDLNVRAGPGTSHTVVGRLHTDAEVPVSGRAGTGRWLALPAIGWIAYDTDWVELPLDLSELPTIPFEEAWPEFVGGLHPPDASSGFPVVDEVAQAVVQGNASALLRMAVTSGVPADEGDGPPAEDAPPEEAPPDENGAENEGPEPIVQEDPPGTTGSCPLRIYPADALDQHVEQFLASEVEGAGDRLHLYAVVRSPEGDPEEAEFVAVFAFERGEGRAVWISPTGEGITGYSLGCEPTPPGELVRVGAGEPFYWLRPAVVDPVGPVE